jgi:hypothetical protein
VLQKIDITTGQNCSLVQWSSDDRSPDTGPGPGITPGVRNDDKEKKNTNMQFTELGSELPDEAVTLRSRHVIIDDDEGPLPIKSTVGMVLDGLTVSMTIPGDMFPSIFRANALTMMRNTAQALRLPGMLFFSLI